MERAQRSKENRTYDMIIDGFTVDAVVAARHCFESDAWQRLSATQRGRLLFDLTDEIEAHADELAEPETLSNGN